jgi:hypothetical protein
MSTFNEEPDDYYPDDDEGYCDECHGEGWILTCCDDMCHGLGYCMHGDGMEMCACNTSCEPPSNAPAEWRWTPIEDDPADCASPSHPGCRKCEAR